MRYAILQLGLVSLNRWDMCLLVCGRDALRANIDWFTSSTAMILSFFKFVFTTDGVVLQGRRNEAVAVALRGIASGIRWGG